MTSALDPGTIGWDWYSLQLSDGSDLMVFGLRRADGSVDSFSSGTLVSANGTVWRLEAADFSVRPNGQWRSPHTGALYPAGWTLEVPVVGLRLEISPYLADQELNLSYRYWEGAVRFAGNVGSKAVTGDGYVELTGYAGSLAGQF